MSETHDQGSPNRSEKDSQPSRYEIDYAAWDPIFRQLLSPNLQESVPALVRILYELGPLLIRRGMVLGCDRETAEDCFTDALMKFLGFDGNNPIHRPTAWFWQVYRHCVIDKLRRKHLSTRPLPEAPIADPNEAIRKIRERVFDAVLALPDHLAEVVILHYFEDLTLAEIVRVLEKTMHQIRTWLEDAKRILESSLSDIYE